MPYSLPILQKKWGAYPWRIFLWMVGWFVFITTFHFILNAEHDPRKIIKMGYMPVITNLAAPLLDSASARSDSPIRFKAMKFASFAEMAESLRNDQIQAAFIIAPLSIVLHQQGEDVRVVLIGNRHESTFVTRKELGIKSIADLEGRTVAVPMRYSGHHLALLRLVSDAGIKDRVRIVEMNPPDMAAALAAGSLDGYFVGEPFAAQTLKSGSSQLLFYVEQVWPDFICNLLLVKQSFIDREPATVQALVQGAARSGLWARNNISQAAQIASQYWGQPVDLVEYALNTPENRIQFDKFTPRQEELQQMADMMTRFGLIKEASIAGLAEERFARRADLQNIGELGSILSIKP
jgi:NitT/TauT family transport system substrate-binding protein